MRALVTGGAGFIGSTLVDRLASRGSEVLVADDLSTGTDANLAGAGAKVERVEISDERLRGLVAAFSPEIVYHLAAQISVTASVRDPALDARSNILGLINVCEAAAAAGARKIVFASSGGTVYGDPPPSDLPVAETYAGVPVSPYGISKRVAHDYLAYYRAVRGLDYTVLALSNVYGPRQDPHGEAGVVAIFSERMLAGKTCVIYGDGEQTRDYVYVEDVVEAFVAAGERGEGEVINIGTGIETSVNALYRAMADALGVTAEPVHADPRPGELRRIALDVTKASRVLGWSPSTPLVEGIAKTTTWFRDRAAAAAN